MIQVLQSEQTYNLDRNDQEYRTSPSWTWWGTSVTDHLGEGVKRIIFSIHPTRTLISILFATTRIIWNVFHNSWKSWTGISHTQRYRGYCLHKILRGRDLSKDELSGRLSNRSDCRCYHNFFNSTFVRKDWSDPLY